MDQTRFVNFMDGYSLTLLTSHVLDFVDEVLVVQKDVLSNLLILQD